jgi:hypothetical protein
LPFTTNASPTSTHIHSEAWGVALPYMYGTVNCLFAVLRVMINLQSLIIAVSFGMYYLVLSDEDYRRLENVEEVNMISSTFE